MGSLRCSGCCHRFRRPPVLPSSGCCCGEGRHCDRRRHAASRRSRTKKSAGVAKKAPARTQPGFAACPGPGGKDRYPTDHSMNSGIESKSTSRRIVDQHRWRLFKLRLPRPPVCQTSNTVDTTLRRSSQICDGDAIFSDRPTGRSRADAARLRGDGQLGSGEHSPGCGIAPDSRSPPFTGLTPGTPVRRSGTPIAKGATSRL